MCVCVQAYVYVYTARVHHTRRVRVHTHAHTRTLSPKRISFFSLHSHIVLFSTVYNATLPTPPPDLRPVRRRITYYNVRAHIHNIILYTLCVCVCVPCARALHIHSRGNTRYNITCTRIVHYILYYICTVCTYPFGRNARRAHTKCVLPYALV